jgi:glycosyltransferase involved in cell wall biosynthesis
MRILQLINTLEPGGAEQIISTLSLQLRARGHKVYLVCLRDKGFMPVPQERFDAAGVEVESLNKNDGVSWQVLRDLASYARARRIQVIHTHNPLVHHYGVAAARLAGIPVVINTVHGTSTLDMGPWAKLLYWSCCRITSRVVSVCDAVERVVRSRFHLSARQCAVIPNGIDTQELAQLPPRPPDGHFVFGTMARLVPVKDHASLLSAFAKVREQQPNCRLEILGDGELEEELKGQAIRLGIGSFTTFHGWSSDIGTFLRRLDAFVLSSKSEGLPLTILEAMAAARPIVATSVGGVPEIVEAARCGWLCRPGDAAGLAAAMLQAADSSQLRQIAERGRRVAQARYSESAMVTSYEELFFQLLGARAVPEKVLS